MGGELTLTGALVLMIVAPGAVGALWGWIVAYRKDLEGWWRLCFAAVYGIAITVIFAGGLILAVRLI